MNSGVYFFLSSVVSCFALSGSSDNFFDNFTEKYYEYMVSHRDLIKEASEWRTDLTKKPHDSKIYNELLDYGVDGSFRALSIE